MKVNINEKKVGVQSEKLEIVKKTDANEMVRKVKKVVKRKISNIYALYINKCNCICTWCSMTVCMCITNDYSKIYVYGIPLFYILI